MKPPPDGVDHDVNVNGKPRVVLDGLFFQIARSGISRLWKSYLEHWAGTEFASHLVVLDRDRSAPRIDGITYRDISGFDANQPAKEMLRIDELCRELLADVFISTYYSTPIQTRSVAMVYDMIFEVHARGAKNSWDEEEKSLAILHANHIVCISHNTARDVLRFFPHLREEDLSVVHCGVDAGFRPAAKEAIATVKEKFGLKKPYFLLVGTRKGFNGYKNGIFLFRTLNQMSDSSRFEIACVGGEPTLEELGAFKNVSARLLSRVSEEDLVEIYSGAEALVYPSRYEGFGLPILEAMACGCPVIACPNGSIPEVTGDAAISVANDDIAGMEAALRHVGDPVFRAQLCAKGFKRAAQFSWKKAAQELARTLLGVAASPEKSIREARVWREFREKERRLAPITELGRTGPKRRVKLRVGNYFLHAGVSRAG